MRNPIGIFAAAVLLMCGPQDGFAKDPGNRYVWPLEDQTKITSAFCDYRQYHYHGGIDISTDGREGFPVRAADSGWVMRVSMSYWGYGKAVYIQMVDGRIAVYGHLSELAPRIQDFVEAGQYAARRYQQNLWPSPNEIPIGRGEIIGATGQTGAGPPHLHFEIRTGHNRPLNPLRFGFEKPDKTPPTIHSVTLAPRHPDHLDVAPSNIDGQLGPKKFDMSGPVDSRLVEVTPSIAGKVGVIIETDDAIDAEKWTLSTYSCRLLVNDVLVTEVRQDSISYDDTRLIDLHRVYDGKPGIAERPVNLFRLPGNRLWHYEVLLNDGWLELGETVMPGTNEVRIVAEDAAGNSSTARFNVFVQEGPATAVDSAAMPGEGELTVPAHITAVFWPINGLVFRLQDGVDGRAMCFADAEMTVSLPSLDDASRGRTFWLPAVAPVNDTVWLRGANGPMPCPLGLQAISHNQGGDVISDDKRARVRFDASDLYESSFFRLERAKLPAGARATVSPVYKLLPSTTPLAHSGEIAIRYESATYPERLAVYRYHPNRQDWAFVGAEHDPSEKTISSAFRSPGLFALLADREPPTIRYVRPGRGERTKERRPTLSFEMFDDLSGIGSDADVRMTIDGEWTVVEYDPDTRQAKARPREPLALGEHRVEISAKDRVGNEETFLRILHIVK